MKGITMMTEPSEAAKTAAAYIIGPLNRMMSNPQYRADKIQVAEGVIQRLLDEKDAEIEQLQRANCQYSDELEQSAKGNVTKRKKIERLKQQLAEARKAMFWFSALESGPLEPRPQWVWDVINSNYINATRQTTNEGGPSE